MLTHYRENSLAPLGGIDPFRTLSLFDELWPSTLSDHYFTPAVEVTETDFAYKVTAELPGIGKDAVKVDFEGSVLTISGEKSVRKEEKDEKVYRSERGYGSFSRSFRFRNIDPEKISASWDNGVLEVSVPKSESVQPRKITIK